MAAGVAVPPRRLAMARPRRAASLSAPRFVSAPCSGSPAQTSPHQEASPTRHLAGARWACGRGPAERGRRPGWRAGRAARRRTRSRCS